MQLRQPKCLLEYERARRLQDGGMAGEELHSANSQTLNRDDQRPQRPTALEKLSTYRRVRSLSQKGADDGVPPRTPGTDGRHNSSVSHRKTLPEGAGKADGPVFMMQLPGEVTKYILEIEKQNSRLRLQVIGLQEELQRQQGAQLEDHQRLANSVVGGNGRRSQDAVNDLLLNSGVFASHEERELYMKDVLAQVDVIVQAHRNQSEAEILKYKQEAERCKVALKQLRDAIELEGIELSMLPLAMASISGKTPSEDVKRGETETAATATQSGAPWISTMVAKKCAPLVVDVTDAVLADLLRVEAGDDVPATVRQSVQRGFEALVRHLVSLVTDYVGHCTAELQYLQKEREEARRELREEISLVEKKRIQMAQQYETEIHTLRDQLHAFHTVAADGDELKATIHERAVKEYTALLMSSREEAESLRVQLEEERTVYASMCLRLKASLQRRSSEFEEAIMLRTEEFVSKRDARIAELEKRVADLHHAETQRTVGRATKGVQVQRVENVVLDEPHFVSNLLSFCSAQKGSTGLNQSFTTPPPLGAKKLAAVTATPSFPQRPSTPFLACEAESRLQEEGSFEEEVWAKTVELLTKYGSRKRD